MNSSPKKCVASAAIAAFALTLGACSSSSDSDKSSSSGSDLKIGIDLTYPPYDTRTGNNPSGLDVDLMDAVAGKMNMKPQFQDTRFAQLIPSLSSGQVQAVASTLYVSAEREKSVDFIPYLDTGNSILSRSSGTSYSDAQSLCGKTVGVLTGTLVFKHLTTDESARCKAAGKPAIVAKSFPTDPEATQALLSGQIDAQMTDAAVAKTVGEKSGGKVKVTSSSLIYPVTAGVAVKKGNTDLFNKIKKAVDGMTSDGSLKKLLDKYGVESVDPSVLAASQKG